MYKAAFLHIVQNVIKGSEFTPTGLKPSALAQEGVYDLGGGDKSYV